MELMKPRRCTLLEKTISQLPREYFNYNASSKMSDVSFNKVDNGFFDDERGKAKHSLLVWGCGEFGQHGQDDMHDITYDVVLKKLKSGQSLLQNDEVPANIVCGSSHSLLLTDKGHLYSWGNGSSGQLGSGNSKTITKPTMVPLNLDLEIQGMACGARHSFIWTSNGLCYSFGNNFNAQLGYNFSKADFKENQLEPTLVELLPSLKILEVACGARHSLFLPTSGHVMAVGCNQYGQIGNDSTEYVVIPTKLDELHSITHVACGNLHSLACDERGKVYAWGYGKAIGKKLRQVVTPLKLSPTKTASSSVISLAGGDSHSMVLYGNGVLYSWGNNYEGQLGLGKHIRYQKEPEPIPSDTLPQPIKQIACRETTSAAVTGKGQLFMWGKNAGLIHSNKPLQYFQHLPHQLDLGKTSVKQVSCGAWHASAIVYNKPSEPGENISAVQREKATLTLHTVEKQRNERLRKSLDERILPLNDHNNKTENETENFDAQGNDVTKSKENKEKLDYSLLNISNSKLSSKYETEINTAQPESTNLDENNAIYRCWNYEVIPDVEKQHGSSAVENDLLKLKLDGNRFQDACNTTYALEKPEEQLYLKEATCTNIKLACDTYHTECFKFPLEQHQDERIASSNMTEHSVSHCPTNILLANIMSSNLSQHEPRIPTDLDNNIFGKDHRKKKDQANLLPSTEEIFDDINGLKDTEETNEREKEPCNNAREKTIFTVPLKLWQQQQSVEDSNESNTLPLFSVSTSHNIPGTEDSKFEDDSARTFSYPEKQKTERYIKPSTKQPIHLTFQNNDYDPLSEHQGISVINLKFGKSLARTKCNESGRKTSNFSSFQKMWKLSKTFKAKQGQKLQSDKAGRPRLDTMDSIFSLERSLPNRSIRAMKEIEKWTKFQEYLAEDLRNKSDKTQCQACSYKSGKLLPPICSCKNRVPMLRDTASHK